MTRPEKGFGERSNDDIIREILREHASRENPIGRKEIIKHVIAMGYVKGKDKSGKDKSKIERKAIEGFVDRMGARVYETENPYMFTGKVERVRIRIDAEQFTQVVDWFSDRFKVVGYDADENKYYDIELKVNLDSFTFWVLQYSGCVEVLDRGKKGEKSYRNKIKETLKKTLEKYEENER